MSAHDEAPCGLYSVGCVCGPCARARAAHVAAHPPVMPPRLPSPEAVSDAIDALTSAIRAEECARVDAGACQTARDWDRYHRAEETTLAARETLDKLVRRLAAPRRSGVRS